MMKKIVLIGAGHAHLEVIKNMPAHLLKENPFCLISPSKKIYYSGLIPRFIMGDIEANDLAIDVVEFSRKTGVEFIESAAAAMKLADKEVVLEDATTLTFDCASLNMGGGAGEIPSRCPERTAFGLRPFNKFLELWPGVIKTIHDNARPRVLIVGGGAASVEVAAALKGRMNRMQRPMGEVILVTRGARLCENYTPQISEKLYTSLTKFGVSVYFGENVLLIEDGYIDMDAHPRLHFDWVFELLPRRPHPFAFVGLQPEKDDQGFLAINSKLQIHESVFAVGDMTTLITSDTASGSLPKSGVTAVREGQHLSKSIAAILNGKSPLTFRPSKKQLNILVTERKLARAIWGPLSYEGGSVFALKDWIDRRYIDRFS